MNHRMREAVRYLGYGTHAVDEKTFDMVKAAFGQLDRIVKPRIIYRIFELEVSWDNQIAIGGLKIESKNLAKNVRGCVQAIMLGATLGIETDMLIRRYMVTEVSEAVVLQACAAAMLEEFLDGWQTEMAETMRENGKFLRPRFSPGYGDFHIRHQKEILQMLDSAKKIGLTMTDSYMLTPTKSVTAVIGISEEDTACHRFGCEVCEKTDCIYRRK